MDEVNSTLSRSRGRVRAADGTRIPYERYGEGPPLVLVGAPGTAEAERPLAGLLAARHAVVVYDRRSHNSGSGDGAASDVRREIEDLAALLDALGGAAAVHGTPSGAALALAAAAAGLPITRLSVYEPPAPGDGPLPEALPARIRLRVLVVDGGASPAEVREAALAVAAALPRGRHRTLTGQTRQVAPHVLAPVLADWLAED
ncbi:alpha/beta fold hydrolase [Streptomyces sp. HUAS MG47]|uniref:alpha/beta fold hydrolase n=1 Tax=Streptomyces solicamelliae TaxID=3231716 RepID=UPI0038782F26